MKKRLFLVVVLILVFVLCLTACGNKKDSNQTITSVIIPDSVTALTSAAIHYDYIPEG